MTTELKKGQLYKIVDFLGLANVASSTTIKTWASDIERHGFVVGQPGREWIDTDIGDILLLVDYKHHVDQDGTTTVKLLFLTRNTLGTWWSSEDYVHEQFERIEL